MKHTNKLIDFIVTKPILAIAVGCIFVTIMGLYLAIIVVAHS